MMVLHVFEEENPMDRADHLEFWFGYPEFGPNYDALNPYQICYCGADLLIIQKDENGKSEVGVVWHKMHFDDIFFDEKGPDYDE